MLLGAKSGTLKYLDTPRGDDMAKLSRNSIVDRKAVMCISLSWPILFKVHLLDTSMG